MKKNFALATIVGNTFTSDRIDFKNHSAAVVVAPTAWSGGNVAVSVGAQPSSTPAVLYDHAGTAVNLNNSVKLAGGTAYEVPAFTVLAVQHIYLVSTTLNAADQVLTVMRV